MSGRSSDRTPSRKSNRSGKNGTNKDRGEFSTAILRERITALGVPINGNENV